ncbi:MAG TPA: hypothetical protein VGX48_00045 [Pyrinomonadaceae bacterium]|nr:hypothetical protein [Pyrinomonadaceae bacterium]
MSDVLLPLLCGAGLLACLLVVVGLLLSRRHGGLMLTQPKSMPPMKSSLGAAPRGPDLALGREILPLLEQGRTPEAVALVRERTGWGAAEAEAAVAELENLRKRLEA